MPLNIGTEERRLKQLLELRVGALKLLVVAELFFATVRKFGFGRDLIAFQHHASNLFL